MKAKIFSGAVLLLLTGCGFSHQLPLHSDYRSIRLNQPLPAKYDQSDTTSISRRTDWGNSTGVMEYFGVIIDNDGIVKGKKYQVEGEEGSLFFLMYHSRKKTEWHLDLNASSQQEIYQELRNDIAQLQFVGNDHNLEELLQNAEADGDIVLRSFGLNQFRCTEFIPMISSSHWQMEWLDANTMKIVIEDRKDISLVVWAVIGWGSWLVTGSFH